MKTKKTLLSALIVLLIFTKTFAQNLDESQLNLEAVTNDQILFWENYFEENYFSQGFSKSDLGEGTGYLPYLRARKFYEERMNSEGKIPSKKRWEAFKESKNQLLNRGGDSPVANWQNLGPNTMESYGGRMISHAFDPFDENIVWAGSASGGLWKTENGGESWISKTDEIPSTGVGAVAVNPQNSNSLLIGTGEGYFLGVAVRPGIGVFKSVDGGETWAETTLNFQPSQGVSAFKLVWDIADTSRVYLAATNGIWISEDAGETWSVKVAGVIADDLLQNPENPEILYAAIESNGIYKSTDSGESWSILTNGLPAGNAINFIHLSMADSFPNYLVASITNSTNFGLEGLYKTNNNGDSWQKINAAPDAFCTPPVIGLTACQGHYDNAVAISPIDTNRILFGGITFWLTEDGGLTWSQKDRYTCPTCIFPPVGKTWVDQHDIGFNPHNPMEAWVFNDGGVAISDDGGNFWNLKNNGLLTAQFYALASAKTDTNVIIGGMQDHGLQGTDLAVYENNEWHVWGFLDGTDVEIDHENENIFYGVWADGQYLKTNTGLEPFDTYFINNGINQAENIFFYFNPMRMDPSNSQILYTATSQRIYKTENGGNNWTAVANIPNCRVLEIDQINPDIIYAASYNNQGAWAFWRSENGGETWFLTQSYPGWRVTDIKADPNEEGVVYATRNSAFANNPHILKSTDYGDTWQSLQNNLPDITVNALTINDYDSDCLYLATDLGVYISVNGGEEWIEYNQNMPVSFVLDIHYHPVDTTLRIGTLGRGAWKTKSYPIDFPSSNNEIQPSISDNIGQAFPSPSDNMVHLNYEILEKSKVKIQIYNNLGQTIKTIFNGLQNAGNQQISWDLKNEIGQKSPNGIYYFSVQIENRAVARKFLVQ